MGPPFFPMSLNSLVHFIPSGTIRAGVWTEMVLSEETKTGREQKNRHRSKG